MLSTNTSVSSASRHSETRQDQIKNASSLVRFLFNAPKEVTSKILDMPIKTTLASDLFELRSNEAQTPARKLQPREIQLFLLNKSILPQERESFLVKALAQPSAKNAQSDFSSLLKPVYTEQRPTPYLSKLIETAAWQNKNIAFNRLVKTVRHTNTLLPESTYKWVAECGQPEKLNTLLKETRHVLSRQRQQELRELVQAQSKAIQGYNNLPLPERQEVLETAARLSPNEIRLIQDLGQFRRWLFGYQNLNAIENRRKVIALLQTPSIDVNTTRHFGLTLLHLAARSGNTETVNALLQIPDINVNATSYFGLTPLHMAVAVGHTETVSALLQAPGININASSNSGKTPLHLAAINGEAEILNALLQAPEIDVNAKNDAGQTPLHLAAEAGRTETVITLLQAPGIVIST